MNTGEEERLRREASAWFARMRGPGGEAAREDFDAWRATTVHQRAYDQLVRRFDESAILGHSRLADLRIRTSRARRAGPPPALWGALAVCLTGAIALAVLIQGRAPWSNLGGERYDTAVGEIRTVALADGILVTLDTDSRLVAGSRDGRPQLRLERGRARVQTTGPVAVRAGAIRIAADRGVFDLARRDDQALEVAAMSGGLDIALAQPGSGPIPVRSLRLQPGQQVTIGQGGAATPRPAATAGRDWPSGLRAFDGAPLGEVVAEANRYGVRKIRLADPSLGRLRVTGGFRVTRPEELAKALAAAFGLTLTQTPQGELLLARKAA
ncbi:FecR family protein [Caulobacter soli]|uniref:FecR family protein n=1 Tax=Caulobacter soli TaxID=2708539 RepID=UPI0013EAA3E2|nr:FecR domain-containing protein [Caulobacter soli]